MTSLEHAAQPLDLADQKSPALGLPARFAYLLRCTLTIIEMDLRKLRHDPIEMFTRAVQPILWLGIFGKVFASIRAIPSGNLPYLDFMAPGILAQSVLFISIFFGIALIWERDLGLVHKMLATPSPRVSLVLGKGLAAGIRALVQAIFIYLLAALMGVKLNLHPLAILGLTVAVLLGATVFSTFSLVIACLVKTRERFMGIGQLMTMPLFFASNAIYPISLMPAWLKFIAHINPLTYQVDALRALMVQGGTSTFGLPLDFAILLTATAFLTVLGARLYRGLAV